LLVDFARDEQMSTIYLLFWSAVTWAIFRLLGARATLATSEFARVFVVGAASSIFGIVIERLAGVWLNFNHVIGIYAGLIDEFAKALPLLIVIVWFAAWRHLTISDYTLLGLAGGLGYTFLNWVLAELGGLAPMVWLPFLFGSLHAISEWEPKPAFFTGAITTAFVGVAAGIGVRLARRRLTVLWVALGALVVAAFENVMYRWQVGPLSAGRPSHIQAAPAVIEWAHDMMFRGQAELWLLVAGLLLANWLEGRWTAVSAPPGEDLLLLDEDATVPLVLIEWIVAAQQLQHGWTAFARLSRYFRERRAWMLLQAEARRPREDPQLGAAAAALHAELVAERDKLRLSAAPAGAHKREDLMRLVRRWFVAHPFHVAAAVLFAIYFLVPPISWGAVKPAVFGDRTALVLIVATFGLLGYRARNVFRIRAASAQQTFATDLETMFACAAAVTLVLAIGVYFIPFETLVPHYGTVTVVEPYETWSSGLGWPRYGGNPHTLFAVAALILTCVASIRASKASVVDPAETVVTRFASAQLAEGA
jgi:hypothetical protein